MSFEEVVVGNVVMYNGQDSSKSGMAWGVETKVGQGPKEGWYDVNCALKVKLRDPAVLTRPEDLAAANSVHRLELMENGKVTLVQRSTTVMVVEGGS